VGGLRRGRFRTHATQQNGPYSITSSATRQRSRRHSQAERFGGSVSVSLWRGQTHRAFSRIGRRFWGADQKQLVSMIAMGFCTR
jgi:hypothetical protein